MSLAAAVLPARLHAELAPTPGRWRYAAFVGFGSTTALALALALQVDTFFAPLLAFTALQPHTLLGWRRLLRCLWIASLTAVLSVVFGGLLVQLPWLLLPVVFLVVSAAIYAIPLDSRLVEALAILPPFLRTIYVGVFHPQHMGDIALTMWAAYGIGVTTATVFARLLAPAHPRDELAAALADGFAHTRRRLREAGVRIRDLARPAEAPPAPPLSALPARLQLLDRARQDGISRDDERLLMALITSAERCETSAELAFALAHHAAGAAYRRAIDGEMAALFAALDRALAGFEQTARRLDRGAPDLRAARDDRSEGALRPAQGERDQETWPDVVGARQALEARQVALRRAGALADVSVAEAANVNAVVAQLRDLAHVVRISPAELERIAAGDAGERAAERAPHSRVRYDPYAATFAMKCGLATVIALQVPLAAHLDGLFSLVVAPFLVAQTSYGATIEKVPLRLLGVVIGGVLAVLTMITLMANSNDVGVWLTVFFAVVAGCAYTVLGGPRVAYVFTQVVVTYLFVCVEALPTTDEGPALWRALGNFAGGLIILGVFRLVAPDYAGRQLIARLRDLLGQVRALLPAADGAPLARALAVHRDIGLAVADLLRLVAEARLEGRQAGIEPPAAVASAGLAQRIAYRVVAIARLRDAAATLPRLPPALQRARRVVLDDVEAHLALCQRVLAARHTRARPGARPYRTACAAAAAVAAGPLPDLAGAVQTLAAQLGRERFTSLADWPASATGTLFAEVEHLERIADLLPALVEKLCAMCEIGTKGVTSDR